MSNYEHAPCSVLNPQSCLLSKKKKGGGFVRCTPTHWNGGAMTDGAWKLLECPGEDVLNEPLIDANWSSPERFPEILNAWTNDSGTSFEQLCIRLVNYWEVGPHVTKVLRGCWVSHCAFHDNSVKLHKRLNSWIDEKVRQETSPPPPP